MIEKQVKSSYFFKIVYVKGSKKPESFFITKLLVLLDY